METVNFTRLSHDKWERAATGSISYSSKGVDIRTADGPTIDHFRVLRADKTVISNLTALDGTYLAFGGRYEVDSAEDERIFLRPYRSR
ncbi:hypothetical protein [Bhargavaea ginsengi]|uniref:hypothetical protein n=1 Tax=Bhargavaea ginsengi TaxID=426757 RepID=UPI003C74218B